MQATLGPLSVHMGGFMERSATLSKLVLLISMLAGASYLWVVVHGLTGPESIAWKGTGVALLALYCAMAAKSFDGWLIALVMALGALGDVLLDINFTLGAASFAVGHIVAIWLYRRNRRTVLTGSQKALAIVLAIGTPLIAYLLTRAPDVAGYAVLLGFMAATAWTSRFPRYRTGIGSVLFVISDLLIFARMGPLAGSALTGIAIWALYYGGQLLITLGVTQVLEGDRKGKL